MELVRGYLESDLTVGYDPCGYWFGPPWRATFGTKVGTCGDCFWPPCSATLTFSKGARARTSMVPNLVITPLT